MFNVQKVLSDTDDKSVVKRINKRGYILEGNNKTFLSTFINYFKLSSYIHKFIRIVLNFLKNSLQL